ncbi:MAG: hypothetical protein ABSG53_32955, partial [Thermoguttaceae bacterium]
PPQNPPQYVRPQYPGLQYQNPVPASPSAVNSMPTVASRDSQATGVRLIGPPAGDGNTVHRLPPVNDPWSTVDPNRDPQGPELVAPNPPEWRR